MTSGARPRIAPLRGTEWSDEARAFLRGHLSRADRHLSGDLEASPPPPILGLLARHPAVGGAWLGFSGTLIEGGSLAERDRELLILRIGHRTRCRYLWTQHLLMGVSAGLDPDACQAVGGQIEAYQWTDRDRSLIRAADELISNHNLSDATWQGISAFLDEQQLLELLFVIGSYVCLGMVLNSVGLEPGARE